MNHRSTSPLRWLRPRTDSPVLLAFPQAGCGARSFGPLQRALGESVNVVALQLPGREDRWHEPFAASIQQVVDDVSDAVVAEIEAAPSWMLLGCSFGGLLGYHMLRILDFQSPPSAMFVASCRAPRSWAASSISDDEHTVLSERLRQRTAELDLDEMSLAFLQRPLLADIELSRTHRFADVSGLTDVPIVAIRGTADPLVTRVQMREWSECTIHPIDYLEISGGHDLVADAPAELSAIIKARFVDA